jgi:hypothetical protein
VKRYWEFKDELKNQKETNTTNKIMMNLEFDIKTVKNAKEIILP